MFPVSKSRRRVAACSMILVLNCCAISMQVKAGVPAGDCCQVHISPGCNQPSVVNCVCGADPFCCDTEWDAICVDEAIILCGASCPNAEACCDDSDGCLQLEPPDCFNVPGSPQGPGSDCQQAPCGGNPLEACCLPDGTCSLEDPLFCQDNDGVPQGTATDCLVVNCPPTEACCFGAIGCQDVTPDFCIFNIDGVPQGPGTNCASGICGGQPPEACCFTGGSCAEIDPAQCVNQNGTPQGAATTCGFEACTGGGSIQACCDDLSGVCVETTVDDCINLLGGSPQGAGTNCNIVTCPIPTGACCHPDGTCSQETIAGCLLLEGFSYPLGSSCQEVDCSDCNENGVPDTIDIAGATSNDVNSNGIPDECDTDCNENGVPDEVDIAGTTSNDINSNGIPDECEQDCNDNDVPDSWEIAQGTATDLDTNGIPDLCDILECRYSDMNYNGLPDAIEIAEGSSTDANTNGIIDEAEEPAGQHSALALLLADRNGNLFVDSNGLPLKVKVNSNGTIAVDSNGFVIPDPNGRKLINWVRDDVLARKLKEALISTNGPNPVSRIKHVKVFMQSCHGGGMLDDLAKAFGKIVCWVGGSAARSNEVARADGDAEADPMGHWTRALRDALINTNGTVLQALKIASRTGESSIIQKPGNRKTERSVYLTGTKGGDDKIPLFDSEATSHHAIFVAGITDQIGIENEITRFCELLESQWGDLNTNGTSVHILFGTGNKNPCTSTNVPNANVLPATLGDLCQLITDLSTNGTFNPNEELLIFGGDHGLGTQAPVNKSGRSAGRGIAPPAVEQEFNLSSGFKFSMTRDPFNDPFIRVLASGSFAPDTVSVSVNGVIYGYLDPNGDDFFGAPESRVFVPEGSLQIGLNDLTIEPNGEPVVILETEFLTGAIAPIPTPGWGDMNGDSDVDLSDLPDFADCLAGPGAGYVFPDCVYADIDEDGDVDMVDGKLLQSVFTGGLP